MRRCDTGRIITKTNGKGSFYFIRLNFINVDESGKKKYTTKDMATGLLANRKNKAQAEAMVADAISQYSSDLHHIYLTDYCDKWLAEKKLVVEITTFEGYEYRIHHIKDFFGEKNILITDVRPQDVKDFYHWMLTTELKKGNTVERGYSNRTIKDTATLFKAILEDAVIMEVLKKNPAKNVKTPQKPTERNQKSYLSLDQIAIFKSAIAGHRLEVPYLMALYLGLRREEILGLRWSCIRDGKIHIEHTVSRVQSTIAKDRAKTAAGYRSYPLIAEIQDKLEAIKAQQEYFRSQMGAEYQDSDYIFTWEDGRPYSPDYLTKSFKKIVRQSELLDSNLTLHSLRASCVSLLIHAGVDIKDTQVWVGHSDVATTLNVYARTNEEQQKNVANTLAEMVFA